MDLKIGDLVAIKSASGIITYYAIIDDIDGQRVYGNWNGEKDFAIKNIGSYDWFNYSSCHKIMGIIPKQFKPI